MTDITPEFLNALGYRRTLQAERIVNCFQSNLQRGRLLDYGCGQGRFVKILRENKVDAFGCDISDSNVEKTPTDDWFIRLQSPWGIPREDGFATISLLDVLEHTENPQSFIGTLRVLNPQQLLIKVPMLRGPIGTIASILARFGRYALMERLLLVGEISPHYNFFSAKGLISLLKGQGYHIKKRRNVADVGRELPDRLRGKEGEPKSKRFLATMAGSILAGLSCLWSDTAIFLFESVKKDTDKEISKNTK